MAAWRIGLNRTHFAVWGQVLAAWLVYVAFGLVAGFALHPRMDEVLFVLFLPLAVLVPYVLLCLGLLPLRYWLLGLRSGGKARSRRTLGPLHPRSILALRPLPRGSWRHPSRDPRKSSPLGRSI